MQGEISKLESYPSKYHTQGKVKGEILEEFKSGSKKIYTC